MRVLILPALLALLVAGCGAAATPRADDPTSAPDNAGEVPSGTRPPDASAGGTAAPAVIDSCTLLTDEDIRTATAEGVSRRTPSTLTQVFSSVCDISFEGGGQVTVSVLPSGGRQMWDSNFAPFIGTELIQEAVSDLGDAAGRSGRNLLTVLEDDVLFEVQYLGGQGGGNAARNLAEIILARLSCPASECAGVTMPPPPTGSQGSDACGLLTPGEIEEALGHPASEPEPVAGAAGGDCRWTLEAGSSFVGRYSVQLSVLDPGGRQRFDFMSGGWDKVPGLGDDAIIAGGNTDGSVLTVVGDRLLTLTYSLPMDTVDPNPQLALLMETALARLGG